MNYQLRLKKQIKTPTNHWSGIAYNPLTKTLFVVDDYGWIFELTMNGDLKRTIKLIDFDDVEGLGYIGGNNFVVSEEARGTLCIIKILPETRHIYRRKATVYNVEANNKNMGLVGVIYSSTDDTFHAIKEGLPKKIYTVKVDSKGVHIFNPFDANLLPVKDLNDLGLAPKFTENYLFLSFRSNRLIEVTSSGDIVSSFALSPYILSGGPQGFTIDDKGTLYVLEELGDDKLFIFDPHPAK